MIQTLKDMECRQIDFEISLHYPKKTGYSFNGLVINAMKYALENMEEDEEIKKSK